MEGRLDVALVSESSCGRIFLASRNDVIEAHMSGSCINSIAGYPPPAALCDRPPYSGAARAFNVGFKRLRLSHVDSRLRRIDGYGGRVLLGDALSWSRGEGNGT